VRAGEERVRQIDKIGSGEADREGGGMEALLTYVVVRSNCEVKSYSTYEVPQPLFSCA
jgi:hypothetical protein